MTGGFVFATPWGRVQAEHPVPNRVGKHGVCKRARGVGALADNEKYKHATTAAEYYALDGTGYPET
jgi:hypothetical protein